MNDCPNAEIRDQLPDLLNERLSMSARAAVMAHVAGCVDCREELELLRGIRGAVIATTPRVDIAYVVNALPKPPARGVRPVRPLRATAPHRTWVDWRVAAAVTLLAVGGSSVAILNRGPSVADTMSARVSASSTTTPAPVGTTAPSNASTGATSPASVTASNHPSASPAQTVAVAEEGANAGLGMAGHLADLNDSQLQALIDEIEQMKAVPITDPEPVSIRIESKSATPASVPESSPDRSPEGA